MILLAIAIINLLGGALGLYYYSYQLTHSLSNPFLLLFIPDCPLYVFLMAGIILLKSRNEVINFIVAVGLVKYGFWTVFVILFYNAYFLAMPSALVHIPLIFLHLGMALEALLILPKRVGLLPVTTGIVWFLANDYMDYVVGTHPLIPRIHLDIVAGVTVFLSLACLIGLFYASRTSFPDRLRESVPGSKQIWGAG